MGISENHARSSNAIHLRGGDPAAWVQALHIAVSEVVAKNEDDIGSGFHGGSSEDEAGCQDEDKAG